MPAKIEHRQLCKTFATPPAPPDEKNSAYRRPRHLDACASYGSRYPVFFQPGRAIMRKFGILVGSLAITAASIGSSLATGLPNNTAFVDPKGGTDSGTCGTVTNQCATLNQGLANVTTGGVVYVQSGATFGPVYLTSSVAITGPEDGSLNIVWNGSSAPGCVGQAAGTCGVSTASYGLEVAAAASDTIKLKNILINNGGGTNGAVKVGNAQNVKMTRIVLRGGTGSPPPLMTVTPNTGSQFQLFIKDGDVAYSSGGGGVLVQPQGSTSAVVDISGTEVHNLKFGFKFDASGTMAAGGIQVSINKAEALNFSGSGIALIGTGSAIARLVGARSNLLNSGQGAVQVNGANALANIYLNTIFGNAIGVNSLSGGVIKTLSNI